MIKITMESCKILKNYQKQPLQPDIQQLHQCPPSRDSFKNTETSSSYNDIGVFCSFERTDNRFSAGSSNSMRQLRFPTLFNDNSWSTRHNIPRNDRYSNSSPDSTLICLIFDVEIFVIRLDYDERYTTQADMCFSNNTITHSV